MLVSRLTTAPATNAGTATAVDIAQMPASMSTAAQSRVERLYLADLVHAGGQD